MPSAALALHDIRTVRDLRRSQIVAAARHIIATQGLPGLTIGAIENELDFTRGVITYHFQNKDEIVEAVLLDAVDDIQDAVRTRLDEDESLEARVRAMLSATVQGFLDNLEASYVLLSFWSRIPSDDRIRSMNADLYAGFRKSTREVLETGLPKGFPDAQIDALSALVVGIVIGVVTQVYFQPGAVDAEAAVEAGVRSILAALAETA